jgi:hypothetical protein
MANSGIDSDKKIVALSDSTLNQIASLSTAINAAAAAANVSPDAIAAPIAREINKSEAGDYKPGGSSILYGVWDATKNTVALYGSPNAVDASGEVLPRLTEQDYQTNLQYVVANGITSTQSSGSTNQLITRLENPVLNDLGVAKIRVETAMEAVAYYDQHPSEFGSSDTLDLQKYVGNTPQLVADLISRATTGEVSVALQAVIAHQADQWASSHVDGWSGYSDAEKGAFTAAYSSLGEAKLNTFYQNFLNAGGQPGFYAPDLDKMDGAAYFTFQAPNKPFNSDLLHDKLTGPAGNGTVDDTAYPDSAEKIGVDGISGVASVDFETTQKILQIFFSDQRTSATVEDDRITITEEDFAGVLQSQKMVFDAGNQLLKEYNPGDGKLAKEVDIKEDDEGKPTAVQVDLKQAAIDSTGGSIGEVFGSAIGRAIAGSNQFVQLGVGTVAGAIGKDLATLITHDLTANAADMSLTDAFGNFGVDIRGIGGSSIASLLTAEIGTALGLNGYGARLFDAAVGGYFGSVINTVAHEGFASLSGAAWSGAFAGAASSIGGALGSMLANQIIHAQTEAGAVGGQLAGAVGSIIGTALLEGAADLVLDLVLPGIGALIGTLLGTVVGDLFGGGAKHPSSIHAAEVQPGQAFYSSLFVAVSNSDGGDTTVSEQLADGVAGIVNAYLGAVGGIGVAKSQTEYIGYQTDLPGTPYIEARPGVPYHYFANANDAVNAAGLDAVLNTEAIGGDLFFKRVHAHATYSDLMTLSGDLQVAQDYERYLDNRDVINALMAANPNSAFTAGWMATFAEASSLGLTHLSAVDFNGGLVGFLHSVKTAGLTFSAANVDLKHGSDGSVTIEIHTGATAAVPGSLVAFADTVNEIDSATGKTVQLVFNDGLAAAGFHGPASASLVSGSWNSVAAAGQNIWFGRDDVPNRFDDPQSVSTNDILIGGAQNDVIYGGTGWNYMDGGAGNDYLFGGPNNDIMRGGPGADYLAGSGGNDTYAFNRGDGTDTVYDDYRPGTSVGGIIHLDGGSDAVAFGTGIALADLVLAMSGNDLVVSVRDPAHSNAPLTDKITLQSWTDPLDRIEYITFADGSFLDISAGTPPNPVLIETSGSTRLVGFGSNYYLDGSTGLGAELKYNGAAVTANQFGGTVAPVGAEQTATGYEVAWKDSSVNKYIFWNADDSGNYLTSLTGWLSGTSPLLQSMENIFKQDINGDGTIGIANSTTIESLGSTSLVQVGNDYYVFSNSTGVGAEVMYGGAPLTVGEFAWTPIGAEQISGGYEIALKYNGADLYTVWNTDTNGNVSYSPTGSVPGANTQLEWAENSFQQDLNGDATIGIPNSLIFEQAGSTSLVQVGNTYFLFNTATGLGPELLYGAAPVTVGEFVWTPFAAEQTSTGYEVALWYNGAYTVWYTDANGNVSYSPTGSVSGPDPLFVAMESSFQQDLNGDGIIGFAANTTLIEAFGSTSLLRVGNSYYLDSNVTGLGPEFQYQGVPYVAGQFGGEIVLVGVEQTASGYEVASNDTLHHTYTFSNIDSSGNFVSNAIGNIWVSGSSPLVEAHESTLHQDLNNDGVIGLPAGTTLIESSGSTSLVQAGNNYYLFDNTSGIGPELIYGGAPVTVGQFGIAEIGAEQISGGYEVALKSASTGLYSVWYTDSNGNVSYAPISGVAAASPLLEAIETSFHQDLNGDGVIGLPAGTTSIESSGSTSLVRVGNNYFLDSNSTGAGPEFKYSGSAYVAGQFGGEILLVGVEQTASGYEMAWNDNFHHTYTFSNIDSNGNFVSNAIGNTWVSGSSPLVEAHESTLHQDINGDGIIGFPAGTTLIESAGSTSLVQVGNHYYLESNSTGTGPELMYGSAPLTVGQFAWTPFAAEQTSTGYEVALTYAGAYAFWSVDTNGNVITGLSGSVESFEPSFQQDLNGDGVIGYAVPSAGSLELSGAISASVQFRGATGTLTLDNSSQFSGQILNFTGAGTPSTSDQIDLKDINYNSPSFSQSFNQATDVLTVNDGSHSANLHFVGSYTAQNFKFASDGANGTMLYDPPASSGSPAVGGASADAFNFVATNPVPQMVMDDLHDAIKAEVAAVKALLGGYAGNGPVAGPEHVPALESVEIAVKSWFAQHDLHVG